MRALTTERIRAVYSLRNFNTKIQNVRVCCVYDIIIGFNESFDDGKDKSCVFVKEF